MSISAVGSPASHALQVHSHHAAPAKRVKAPPAKVSVDSDGDHDGTKGGKVDVRG